jgi:predicted dehydrogenase
MKIIVVGLGVQGYKRRRIADADCVATVDVRNPEAQHKDIREVPLDSYDAALLCVPDGAKIELIDYLIRNGKHTLVEKPLTGESAALQKLQADARAKSVVVYVAYNHRFEPNFVRMRDLLASGKLGRIYRCRIFYGNGTARLVRDSLWRDQGAGVLDDLGSHLLDTLRFWFGDIGDDFHIVSADRFENKAPDHVVFASGGSSPRLECEMTLLSWRNHLDCDVFAENGTAHIRSLCKWGPSEFIVRERVLPSGRPHESAHTEPEGDPTWVAEYEHFKSLCQKHHATDLSGDIWINRVLKGLGNQAGAS